MGRGSVITPSGESRGINKDFKGVEFITEEGFEGLEVEAKIDVVEGTEMMGDLSDLSFLTFPEAYEVIAPGSCVSSSHHDFYALGPNNALHAFGEDQDELEPVFTVMKNSFCSAWKFKGETRGVERSHIVVLERKETIVEDIGDSKLIDLMGQVTQRAASRELSIRHVGTLEKVKSNILLYHSLTRRAFVVTPSICSIEGKDPRLYQVEVEYAGLREGSSKPCCDIYDDVAVLTSTVKEGFKEGMSGEYSTLTKFDWLRQNVRSSR